MSACFPEPPPPRITRRTAIGAIASGVVLSSTVRGGDLPVTGSCPPELAPLDEAIQRFMAAQRIRAGTCVVTREERVLMERGYGWADAQLLRPVWPRTRMRIASITKVFTHAAVNRLMAARRLSPSDRAFDLLGHDLRKIPGADPRLARITVTHLIRHQGGWDREKAFDPLFADSRVMSALRIADPPGPREIVRFMLTQPLQFDPGARTAYSNFGYCVLGQLVEQASRRTFSEYLREQFLDPLGLASIEPGQAGKPLRNETWYDDPAAARVNLNAHSSAGGLVASAHDLCAFLRHYTIGGEPRDQARGGGYFIGTLPGTTALVLQRRGRVNVALLLNRRAPDYKTQNEELRRRIENALRTISTWPA